MSLENSVVSHSKSSSGTGLGSFMARMYVRNVSMSFGSGKMTHWPEATAWPPAFSSSDLS